MADGASDEQRVEERMIATAMATTMTTTMTTTILQQQQLKNLRTAQLLVYLSHFVSQFAKQTWEFALVLFLAAVTRFQSILLVSTYQLTSYAAVSLLGSTVGRFLDVTNRLLAARICIFVETGSVLIGTICCCWLLTRGQKHHYRHPSSSSHDVGQEEEAAVPNDMVSIILIVGVHVFGSLAKILDQGFMVAIERDWIVVLSQHANIVQQEKERGTAVDDEGGAESSITTLSSAAAAETWLSQTNVALRQIYLSCKVLAPAVAGWIIGQASKTTDHDTTTGRNEDANNNPYNDRYFCDLHGASVLVVVLNVTSLLVVYACTAQVYHVIPALSAAQGLQHRQEQG